MKRPYTPKTIMKGRRTQEAETESNGHIQKPHDQNPKRFKKCFACNETHKSRGKGLQNTGKMQHTRMLREASSIASRGKKGRIHY